jgi:hypothetical protein
MVSNSTYHLKSLNTKSQRHLVLEIQILARDRLKNVAELNRLMGSHSFKIIKNWYVWRYVKFIFDLTISISVYIPFWVSCPSARTCLLVVATTENNTYIYNYNYMHIHSYLVFLNESVQDFYRFTSGVGNPDSS